MLEQPKSAAEPIRVLIVDDHRIMRQALRGISAQHCDFEVIGEAEDGEEAIRAALRLRPSVTLMDVQMPRLDGIAARAMLSH